MTNLKVLLSDRVQRIKPSPTLAVAARAEQMQAEGKNVISLSLGEPDFDTPHHIKEAAIKAIHDGHTKYTPIDGTSGLKKAIIDKFQRENNLSYTLPEILVSCGAKHSIYNALSVLLNPGDEVIIPAPYWVSYPDMVMLCSGNPVFVQTTQTQKFKLLPEQLEAAITPKTRAFIMNSPSNPTGVSYSKEELAALAEVLLKHPQIVVLSDDIYEHHQWKKPFVNIVNACPELKAQTLVINSVSKTYAMTGWRIGYTGGSKEIIAAMRKAQSQNTSSPNSIAQYASEAALNGSQACVAEMTKAYKERHDYLYRELQTIPGIDCIPSDGTFYNFPDVSKLIARLDGIDNDVDLAELLLNKAEVAVIPGTAFGGVNHIRLCYTTSMPKLIEAVARMKKVFQV